MASAIKEKYGGDGSDIRPEFVTSAGAFKLGIREKAYQGGPAHDDAADSSH